MDIKQKETYSIQGQNLTTMVGNTKRSLVSEGRTGKEEVGFSEKRNSREACGAGQANAEFRKSWARGTGVRLPDTQLHKCSE